MAKKWIYRKPGTGETIEIIRPEKETRADNRVRKAKMDQLEYDGFVCIKEENVEG